MGISRVLVANRGEIAVRIIAACRELGIDTVLATSEADRESLAARLAARVICIGPGPAAASYLDPRRLVCAAQVTDCDALHPGYGFLSESPELAEACLTEEITFVGPRPDQIRSMGNKVRARALAAMSGVPTLPGSEGVRTLEEATVVAQRIGYPVMLKAAAGGGGRGVKVVEIEADLAEGFTVAGAEARAAFTDGTLYVERFIRNARHIEVQVLGDQQGTVLHLGERDCSLQRRHQKMVEESLAPHLTETHRGEIRAAAVAFARSLGYENAGTVEFLFDKDSEQFYFLEMNTRLQVEHPVTEMVTGIDIVQAQLRLAAGEPLWFDQGGVVFRGHAIECRVTAERAEDGFRPAPGIVERWLPPIGPNIRLDSHCYAGYTIPLFYDSLLGKLIAYGSDREEAISRLRRAIEQFDIGGVANTLGFLHSLLSDRDVASGNVSTHLVADVLNRLRVG